MNHRYTQAHKGIASEYTETQRKLQCFCVLCGNCGRLKRITFRGSVRRNNAEGSINCRVQKNVLKKDTTLNNN